MIYILDRDTMRAAKALSDEDIIRSIPEVVQTLCGAHAVLDGAQVASKRVPEGSFEVPITNLTRWAASDYEAYMWLLAFGTWAIECYRSRFKRTHVSFSLMNNLFAVPQNIPDVGWMRPPPLDVPKRFASADHVAAYRNAYFHRALQPHWSSPHAMPAWYAEKLVNEIKELQP